MDILVKIERFQIKPNVINLKSTLVRYIDNATTIFTTNSIEITI